MTEDPGSTASYAFDVDRAEEERRLIAQSQLLAEPTERWLCAAGLGPGMRVVELGTGAGDTAMLAARLVGPTGSVVGIERNPSSVELARRRIADAGLANVTLVEADVAALGDVLAAQPQPVDAVIGRLILMWTSDRLDVLKACAAGLRPGALVWFLEPDMEYVYACPATPSWDEVRRWVLATLQGIAVETRMSLRLHESFRTAGLPAPQLRCETLTAGWQDAPVWFWANIIRGVVPLMEQLGIVSAAEVDIDTLESRLIEELRAVDGVMFVPPIAAAWARV